MKIIQTLWTAPGLCAGWMDKRYHFLSWALSCLQLRKFYDEVELYTDDLGKKLLIDRMSLPYTKVHLTLNDFPYPKYLWAAPKLLSYGLQEEPFLHIDGDIFLFKPLNASQIDRDLVYQNEEWETIDGSFYTFALHDIQVAANGSVPLPRWITEAPLNRVRAICAGVFGGRSIPFFKRHSTMAFDFLDRYAGIINRMKQPARANHLAEQYLAIHLRAEADFDHVGLFTPNRIDTNTSACLSSEVPADTDANLPTEFSYSVTDYFGISPYGRRYVHLTGVVKAMGIFCRMLGRRMLADYPEYYHRVIRCFGEEEQPKEKRRISLRDKALRLSHEKVFNKTHSLFWLLTSRLLPAFSLNDVPPSADGLLTGVDDPDVRRRIEAIFQYDKERFQFALASPSDEEVREIEENLAKSQDQLYDPFQPDLDNYEIRCNPHVKVVNAPYNWLQQGAYALDTPIPSPTKIAIHIDAVTQTIAEMELTLMNEMLLSVFREPRSYTSGLEVLQQEFVVVRNMDTLEKDYFVCVVYMITNGMLLVTDGRETRSEYVTNSFMKIN